jgi:Ti-type conjugative transfer relaxase TraA
MLSIGKLAAGPDAGRYYEEAVARGREDYYRDEGEAPGRWLGGGAERLGLAGQVNEGEVGRLLGGEHPRTGGLLGRSLSEGSVAGFDLTFKAPKSVSILAGIAPDHVRDALHDCHERAVTDALAHLERETCRARRGKDGVVQVRGEGFLAAAFRHRTSRAGDPLLHTHVVVANRTLGPDGRWTALDARPMYKHAKTAGFIYQARLRHEVSRRLGLEWGEVVNGSADLAGFSRKLIDHFSTRRAEIVRELALRGEHSLLAAQTVALVTRKGKDYDVPIERLREEWRARAAEHGFDRRRMFELFPDRVREREVPATIDVDKLTERRGAFTRRDVLQATASCCRDGATADEIERLADATLDRHDVIRIAGPGGARFTTRAQVELERALLDSADRRQHELRAVTGPGFVREAIAARPLTEEQADIVRDLCSSGRGIEIVRAPAGTGKTYALDAARQAWSDSGREIVGCALSARAACELRDQTGIETTTIARLKIALEQGHQLPRDGVLIVDEAGMVGTRDLAHLAETAETHGTKLMLVGDDRQLPEIEAGGAFRALGNRIGAHELKEVRRQRDAWDRAALRDLRDGEVERWAAAYADAGRLVTAPTAPAVREQLVTDWWHAVERGDDAAIIALRRSDTADLNNRARGRMRDAGRLRGEDVQVGDRSYAEGDRVILGKNDRHLDVVNGDRGEVLRVDERHVDVELGRGPTVQLPADYAIDRNLDHGYAITAHKAQGATFDRTFVLGSEDAYREWGYTAMSRHRESATFYVTEPSPFLNSDVRALSTYEELADLATRTLSTERRQELAIEAMRRGRDLHTGLDFGP